MTCSSGTKRVRSGSATKRGSSGGTLTRANRCSPRRGVAHRDREVEREVRDVGERVRGVDGERGEHREDARLELAGELGALVRVELVPVGELDAGLLRAPGATSFVNTSAWRRDELFDAGADRAELLDLVEAVGRVGADPRRELLLQAGRRGPGRTRRGWS